MDVNTKKLSCLLLFVGLLFLSSCLKETAVPIASSFEVTIAEDKTSPVTVKLQNNSYGADEYEWTFEGGISASSSKKVVEYPDLAPIYYEFKSVTVLPPNRFVEQFSKDQSRPNFNINNLRWVFDGKKITRQDLDKLRRDIEKALSRQFPTMPKEEKEQFAERILNKVFIVN